MAETRKILGQRNPSATTETTLYTCPVSTEMVSSSIIVCNLAASAATFRISVSPDGGATGNEDYLYYDTAIPANDTFAAKLGITLDSSDVIRVYASTANLAFNLFGAEIT